MDIELSGEAASKLSFPDCKIDSFSYQGDTVSFRSNGIYIEGSGFLNDPVEVRITSGRVNSRDFSGGVWTETHPATSGGLRQIGEWDADSESLRFAGFKAVSSVWCEFVVREFNVRVVSLT